MDDWVQELRSGRPDVAWDRFLDRYRRLVFSAIRHYAHDADDVMDIFAHVCEALHSRDLARLRRYADAPAPAARFSTWLVTVVRNLTVDWFRHRDGRPRRATPAGLSPLQQRIFQHVFIDGDSHAGCFERLRLAETPPISSHQFAEALTATYRLADATGHGAAARGAAPPPPAPATPEQELFARLATDRVAALLASLDPADRLAVQLFVLDELPAADVARIVGWPNPKMVYNRVSRGLAMLRHELEGSGFDRHDR